jgi:L-ascorbate metabolism protein UlaG (beta-lactamase superfamily)
MDPRNLANGLDSPAAHRAAALTAAASLRALGGRCLLAVASLTAADCSVPTKLCITLPSPPPPYDPVADKGEVQVTFLGVGGVLIRWQGTAIMTAPLYSNPTIGEIALSEAHTDRQRLDALMRQDVSGVRAILSGHSHYDHLMDVPYVALHKATRADVIGNDEMRKLLHPIEAELEARTPPNHLVSLECATGWVDVAGDVIRVKAIVSEHSPQIGRRLASKSTGLPAWLIPLPDVTLWRGEDEHDLDQIPTRIGGWPAGTPLAFVIELRDPATHAPAFRIYYQDSSTRQPYGYPDAPTEIDRYDLAILTMGGATEFRSFPQDIVGYLKPKFVMGVHWDDFFNPRQLPLPTEANRKEDLRYAPGVSEDGFLKAVRSAQPSGGRSIVPCPDKATLFARVNGSWEIGGDQSGWSKAR